MEDLPTEILQRIFKCVHNEIERDMYSMFSCSHVCKAWEIPARHALYNNIELTMEVKIHLLANTVRNKKLGPLVKAIEFSVRLHPSMYQQPHFKRMLLHLPNLEVIYTNLFRSEVFPSLHTILLKPKKLLRLKRIPPLTVNCPKEDAAACIFLLQYRLEDLDLDMNRFYYDMDHGYGRIMDDLYSKLQLFTKLKILHVNEKKCDCEIKLIEDVTTRCPSLTRLTLTFAKNDTLSQPSTTVTEYTPQLNIKYLSNSGPVRDLTLYMSYIMHKFPQLETLGLYVTVVDKWKGLSDPTVIRKVMDYLSSIKQIYMWGYQLTLHSNSLYDVTESYRKSSINSIKQLEYIKFTYHAHDDFKGDEVNFEKKNHIHIGTAIDFYRLKHEELTELEHTRFLENYGSRYREVKIRGLKDCLPMIHNEQIKDLAQGEMLAHALTHCPHLQVLTLEACLLENITSPCLTEKKTLNTLHIDECTVHQDMLKQVSTQVSEIKSLKLTKNTYLVKDEDGMHQETINILAGMECTTIGTLEIEMDKERSPGIKHLYLSKVTEEGQIYYQGDIKKHIFVPCSKQEFDEGVGLYSQELRIFLNFQHIEKLVVKYGYYGMEFKS